jgi:glycosyltransferase involved in cell wall biosynthesis
VGSVTVGIPAYNEESTIASVVTETRKHVSDVLVVDDGSTDETAAMAEAAGATVVTHERNQGYGSALKTLFVEADSRNVDHLVILDADGQHDPSDVKRLVEGQRTTGAAIVIGSRFAEGAVTDAPLYRRFGLTVVNSLTNLGLSLTSTTLRLTDTQSGFRIYDAAAIETMSRKATLSDGMDVSIDILFEAVNDGHEIAEVPIDITYDVEDASTHHPLVQGLVLLLNILARLYTERPSQLLNIPAFLCIVAGGGLAIAMVSNNAIIQTVPIAVVGVLLCLGAALSGAAFVFDKQASK